MSIPLKTNGTTTIEDIIRDDRTPCNIISDLKQKSVDVPSWGDLVKEYDPKQHPVYTDNSYRDKVKGGKTERMTRITYSIEKQAVKRMKELMFTIPVRRKYTTQNEQEKRAAAIMEAIFRKNHIDGMNIKRGHRLFASCEIATIWFTQEAKTAYAGEKTNLKLRCRTFSPMDGDALYPLFDEYDDMIALSIEYKRVVGDKTLYFFDTYTDSFHWRWQNTGGGWEVAADPEEMPIPKISGVYMNRPEPIWEDQAQNGHELEWILSRNGNYLRKNSRPTWVICSDNASPVRKDREPSDDNAGRNVLRYGKDDKAGYATWNQAIESLKFQAEELRRNIHTTLQLPDMSMEQMKSTPMSGEARKMLFIDCQMKVTDESGDWLEFFDREVNVVREFGAIMYPELAEAFRTMSVENEITPYQINDFSQQVKDLYDATGGKAVMSQQTGIRRLGVVPEEDVEAEMQRIQDEEAGLTDTFSQEPTA